jgi:hypothetical protein
VRGARHGLSAHHAGAAFWRQRDHPGSALDGLSAVSGRQTGRVFFASAGQTRSLEGAGETTLRDIAGERFDVQYRGAGSMKIAGTVRQINLQAQGVGEVDARKLIAQDANVTFQGIGSFDLYASGRLDAMD